MVPCYNEVDNAAPMAEALISMLEKDLSKYDYEIVFIDNCSTDGKRDVIEELCEKNKKIKAIFNVTNFGQFNSPFYGMCQCKGDCVVPICCDFQDPVDMIPKFVAEWEKGYKIVSAIKTSSKESGLVYFLRTVYYRMIKSMSSVKMIEHFTGFGLYDKTFINLISELDDPIPFLRGIVAEYGEGFNMTEIEYEQQERRSGKSHNNFYSLYDAAMLSFTSYTKVGLRLATFFGMIVAGVSFITAIVFLVLKIKYWGSFSPGYAPTIIVVSLLGGVQLMFLGLLGEYILNINTRVIHRPIVVEEKRINFD